MEKVITGLTNLRDAIADDYIREVGQAVKTIDDAIALLMEEQTEIVRCRDCKHYFNGSCPHVGCIVNENAYCSDGERK